MIRIFDFVFSTLGLIALSPLLLVIFGIGLLDTGSPLFFQERVGRYQKPFMLVKFRTMKVGTPSVSSHLVEKSAITAMGHFLRNTKLDELPQLWNVMVGEMSLVGPRPGLFNQTELMELRLEKGVYFVRPGITGLAQVRGVTMEKPELLSSIDVELIETLSARLYFVCILRTVFAALGFDFLKSKEERHVG